jgi:primosomal protein N' (replication factor Y)
MHYYEVVPLKIVHGSQGILTYQFDSVLKIGTVVSVPVGKQTVAGVITGTVTQPSFETKAISSVLEAQALPSPLLDLAQWLATYYVTHPVTVWQTILPRGVGKTRRATVQKDTYPSRKRTHIVLNTSQTTAVESIMGSKSGTTLLHGVTGSGKTQIYIETAKLTVADGKSVIILVPEIALTSQLIAEFTPHFPGLKVTHSTMTESVRHQTWQQLLTADIPASRRRPTIGIV